MKLLLTPTTTSRETTALAAMWNALHNAQHPRGAELQRKLQAGHALSDRDLRALHASPTANWWGQRDEKTSTSAMRKATSGYVLNAHELSALRNRAASRLPPIVVPDHSPRRSRPDRRSWHRRSHLAQRWCAACIGDDSGACAGHRLLRTRPKSCDTARALH